ncbi:DUF4157 domain-containing protein [Aquimarina litoralis]|uniref:eCIS core domain-containing protein n=1 Tax=Aquimarina litoralis TaxID=584605 RepID=UPI001C59EA0B|nr:DUF4157 domain-containing protein [Aquimarina litoralis]MBW1297383.1 DUF4157 domain-containing protein [Aquimarina litoralis]
MFTTATRNTTTTKSNNSSLFQKENGDSAFIQPKLNIGKPGDKYEIEADKVADTVVAKGNDQTSPFFSPAPQVQKQQEEDVQKQEITENTVQQKPLGDTITPFIQRQTEDEVIQQKEEQEEIQQKPEDEIQKQEVSEDLVQSKVESTNITTELQKQEEDIQEKEEEEEDVQLVQMKSYTVPNTESSIESRLQSSKGSGSPLPKDTKTQMESGFGRDFSNVRVHTDSNAKQMSQDLGAQAFTHGNDIYFNEGKFDTSSNSGKHLLAHELTHTVQQGASTVRKKPVEVTSAPQMVQGSFLDWIPDWILDNARNIPGYLLFTVIIQYDPLRGQRVEPTPTNLLRGLIGLVPFGVAIFDKLQEYAILQRVFDWVTGKLSELNLTTRALLDLVEETWENNSVTSFIGALREEFSDLVDRITTFASSLVDQIIDWIKEALIDVAEPILAENRAWSLIKKIIHYDPLRDEEVSATTVEILEDFLILIGKETELEQMRERGTLQETADWLDTQVGTFMSLLGELRGLINAAWEAIRPANLTEIATNLTALSGRVTGFLERVWAFASTVAIEVLKLIKKALLSWLSSVANETRGFSLVKVIIGKDPFTDEHVPRTVPNLIRGFMSLMEGGEAQYAQMVETGAIARIVGEIEAAVETLNMTPQSIVQLFTDLWNSFTIDDLLNPIDAFMRIIERFGEPIGRLIAFVAEIVRIVIVGILEIMNFPFDLIGNIITRSLQAIEDIKRDPIGFLKNILRAIKEGFIKFFDNIVTHLINGVMGWLMRELRDAGIPELTDFSLQGVISWVLEVLGLSMERIWEKLAEHPRIGPERVARIRGAINTLEGIWTFIKDVQERGIAAIWDKIQEQLSNLWNVVIDAVKNFVMTRIITQVTTRLLSMLDPTGIMAVVNGAIAFFNAVQSFIQYLREMLEVINSFVNGVADIARGNVATAADYLERTMGQSMPVVIGFLANQVGLGGIGARIAEIIGSVRALIDEALTWLVNKAVDTGMALLDRVMAAGASARDAVLGWLGLRKRFTTEGETHNIFLRGSARNVQMWIASDEMPFVTLLSTKQTEINEMSEGAAKNRKQDAYNNASSIYNNDISRIINLLSADNLTDDRKNELEAELNTKFDEIVPFLVTLGVGGARGRLPNTQVSIGGTGGRASYSEADPLTKNGSRKPPRVTAEPDGWATHIKTINNYSNIYVRLHLLHFDLGGPGGDTGNVTPGRKTENQNMYNQAESNAVDLVHNQNRVLWYRAEVTGYRTETGYTDFAEAIRVTYGFKEKNENGEWVRVGDVLYDNVFPVSKPDPAGSNDPIPSINNTPFNYWDSELKNIPGAPSRSIYREWVTNRGASNYTTWAEFTSSSAFMIADSKYNGSLESWFRAAVGANKLRAF